MNEIVKYIAACITDNIFIVASDGMEFGIQKRKFVGSNNGVFDKSFISDLVRNAMDDRDIYNDVGGIAFDYVLKNIPSVCRECLVCLEKDIGPEAEYFKENYPDIYNNCVQSLNKIASEA